MEKNILIARRIVGKGDCWQYCYEKEGKILYDPNNFQEIFKSITELLEDYVTKTKYKGDFKLCPLKGEIHIIEYVNDGVKESPVKKFNLYDEK